MFDQPLGFLDHHLGDLDVTHRRLIEGRRDVVGGVSGGCVVAARQSEDPAVQVALIEAGPMDDAPKVHTPVAFPQLLKSEHNWDYSSEPEPGRRIYQPRGKVLGGCSSMNAMIYIRGNRADYDEGATGWSYDELLPCLTSSSPKPMSELPVNFMAPMDLSSSKSQHPLIDRIIKAFGMFDDRKRPSKRKPSLTITRSRSRSSSRARD